MATDSDKQLLIKLKKMLISRDASLQHSAAKYIFHNLMRLESKPCSYGAFIEYLISNDVCVYLGEACTTPRLSLLKELIKCLKRLSKADLFFKKSYASLVTSSIVRAIHFYMKESESEDVIKCLIYFLSEIFSGVKKCKLAPILSLESQFDSLQILKLLQEIISPSMKPDTLLISSKVLHLMISNGDADIKLNSKVFSAALDVISVYLTSLNDLLMQSSQCLDDYFNCTFGMICCLCVDALVLTDIFNSAAIEPKRIKLSEDLGDSDQRLALLLQMICQIMKILTTKMKKHESAIDSYSFEIFMKFIDLFFKEKVIHELMSDFASILADNDFLVFFPKLRARSTDKCFRKLCQMNLAELLVALSSEHLNLSDWRGGKSSFRNHIFEGLMDNDEDFNDWPKMIFDKSVADSKINALIVFLYFYCISTSRSEKLEKILLPHIIYYVLGIPTYELCPLPITKCIWLIFAIASSNDFNITSVKCEKLTVENANEKLVLLIKGNIKDVYTHHSAIIEWTYSSARIPNSIQNDVIQMWLRHEKSLPSNLLTLPSVWWTLLDVVQGGINDVAQEATELLKYCISNMCDEINANKIKQDLWKSLPDLLAYFIENKNQNEESLGCLLNLCSTQIPKKIDLDIVNKSAFFLMEILPMLNYGNSNLMSSFMSEAYTLLKISLKHDSSIVLSSYLSSAAFIKHLQISIQCSDDLLSIINYNFLSMATSHQGCFNLDCDNSTIIHPLTIVKLLEMDKESDKCQAVLQMVFTYFYTARVYPKLKPLFRITIEHPYENKIDCFRSLFFRLQMICCKDSKSLSEGAWQCMNAMLQYSASKTTDKLTVALVGNKWTHILIRFYLNQNEACKAHKRFLVFTFNWLSCVKIIREKSNVQSDKNDILFETMAILSNSFDEETRKKFPPERKSIADGIIDLISSI